MERQTNRPGDFIPEQALAMAQENERLKAINAALLAALDAWVAHTGDAPQLGGNLAAIDRQIRAAIANARGA